jgi:Ca2+-binding RTX toxin-like protein
MLKRLALIFSAAAILTQVLPLSAASAHVRLNSAADYCHGHLATVVGTEGDDVLLGTPGTDVIVGLGGNDLLKGYAGDDIMCGGAGSDDMYGHEGNDTMYGGADNDSLEGNADSDTLYLGGTGSFDPAWSDELRSGNIACGDCSVPEGEIEGDDTIIGGPGTDGCMTQGKYAGAWWISGSGGNDYINLKGGNDCAFGNSGDDTILGGSGNDMIAGGTGSDIGNGNGGQNMCAMESRKNCN